MRPLPQGSKISLRNVLLLIAAALVVTAIAGPVQRAWQARSTAAAAKTLADQVAREREARTAELAANRTQIMARLREQLRNGDHAGAMAAAARFADADDPEVREIHRLATAAVSAKQDIDGYRKLVDRDCTEANVRYQLVHLLDRDTAGGSPAQALAYGGLQLTRLAGSEASAFVITRLREPHATEAPLPPKADWITRVRAFNRSHPAPEFVAGLLTESAHALICVWRIEGTRRDQARSVPFTMVLWLIPARDGKGLRPDPVAYSERAS